MRDHVCVWVGVGGLGRGEGEPLILSERLGYQNLTAQLITHRDNSSFILPNTREALDNQAHFAWLCLVISGRHLFCE